MKTLANILLISLLVSSTLASNQVFAGSKECKKYKTKLEKVKSKQRHANSVKASNKLKEKESKLFKKWQRCKQGKKV